MRAISRRQIVRNGPGFLLATSLTSQGMLSPSFAVGEETAPSVATGISPDLQDYLSGATAAFIAKATSHGLQSRDLLELADQLHLFGRHLDTFDMEPFRKMVLSLDTSAGTAPLLNSAGVTEAYSRAAKAVPGMTLTQFHSHLTFTSDQLETGKAQLANRSVGGQFHSLADIIKDFGRYGIFDENGHLAPLGMPLGDLNKAFHVSNGVYDKEAEAHLREAGLCGKSWHFWCALIAALIVAGLAIAAIWAGAATVAAVIAAAAAVGVTISAAVAANILATIGILAGLIGAICGLPT